MDRIYIVTDRKLAGEKFFEIIDALLKEGYRFIQLRENDLSAVELCRMVEKILDLSKGHIDLVINDRVDIAHIYQIFGVQLKEVSIDPLLVKKYFPKLKIGLSLHNEESLVNNNFADFYLFGNVFETSC
ncbi:MAG: thiamine phosphate synthase, partial [Proteobacteria bacterium]|nr:thiamine phosphate synthase [Pseudomonadota bacterium]